MKKYLSRLCSLFLLAALLLCCVGGAAEEADPPFTVNVNVSFDPSTDFGQTRALRPLIQIKR